MYGHKILIAETFVDQSRFKGTCYKAANWIPLGKTKGFARKAKKYIFHGNSKTIMVYPLHRKSRQFLSAPFLVPELTGGKKAMIDVNSIKIENENGLLEVLAKVTDPRKARGIRHNQCSILAIVICGLLSNNFSVLAIAEWAKDLSQDVLKRLNCSFSERLKKYIPPSEPTIRRTLQNRDAEELDEALGKWLQSQTDGKAIAIDGKTLCGTKAEGQKPIHLVAALLHKEGIVAAQKQVIEKSNEITAFQPLLDKLDIEGKVITADAIHTHDDNAKYIVEEKKGDYLFEVKGNQPTLLQDIKALEEKDFSP